MSRFISSEHDIGASQALDNIERHVAWLYTTGLRARHRTPLSAQRVLRLVHQILAETEAFSTLPGRIPMSELDGDAAIDVSAVLTRALDHWRVALTKWRDEAPYRALGVSARHLVEVAERLLDALTSAALGRQEEAFQTAITARVQKTH